MSNFTARVRDFFMDAKIGLDLARARKILMPGARNKRHLRDQMEIVERVLTSGKVPIFFSYKQKDLRTARTIHGKIKGLLRNKVDLIWDQDFLRAELLHEIVKKTIQRSVWFLLLLPDPSDQWDWPLFEGGIFTGMDQPSTLHKVFILHHSANQQPKQFGDALTIMAHPSGPNAPDSPTDPNHPCRDIYGWLKSICRTRDYFPGMPALWNHEELEDHEIAEVANEINRLIAPPRNDPPLPQLTHCKGHVKLLFADVGRVRRYGELTDEERDQLTNRTPEIQEATRPEDKEWLLRHRLDQENIELLDKAQVLVANPDCLEIFGWVERAPETWGELVADVVRGKDDRASRWRAELCLAMKLRSVGRVAEDIQATFESAGKRKSAFRPNLYALDDYGDVGVTHKTFYLLFVEDVAVYLTEGQPTRGEDDYSEIASSMRHSYRFAWEIVEPFKNLQHVADIEAVEDALGRVMKDYESHGEHQLHRLARLFDQDEQQRIDELYGILKNTLEQLKIVIKQRDIPGIRKLLAEFEPVNLEYLSRSSRWFCNRNEELWAKSNNGASEG